MSEQVSTNTKVHGAVEECLPTSRRVPGSTPGEMSEAQVQTEVQFEVELPQLRLYDQTPTADRKTAKRPCTELSPIQESPTKLFTDDMWKQIERTITTNINNAMPNIIENIVCELQCTFQGMIDQAITTAKTEIYAEVKENIDFVDSKIAVRTKCEAEQLENYNRRDNIKILGLREDVNGNGEIKGENIEQTLEKVIDLSKKLEADVDSRDISIAHRLPSRKGSTKPIIVKFSRRMAKVNILRKKKLLYEQGSEVRIFEDISRPRVLFLNLMRQDNRIGSAYTKDGAIYYTMKDENRVYKIQNLYEGASDLNYSLHDLRSCFRF